MDPFFLKMKGILLNNLYRFIWMIKNKIPKKISCWLKSASTFKIALFCL